MFQDVLNWIVYLLRNPRTQAVKYVGATVRTLEIRKNEHYRFAEVSQEHRVHRGVYSLLCSGIHPAIEEIEHGLGEGRHECEKFWIAFSTSSWAATFGTKLRAGRALSDGHAITV